ncbi:family 16 glycosylhydrolase [Phytoactinopolyspora halotolerans]|uniref:licheninase n=1 Tax=Phytoactinopolyspora halotolerans TaxID=1981512 RepID=A0A6L9S987_9ACTN|nr:family 16 glycosylhydrolase [Phytoactinopolyspora halotolerans]NEE01639.1 family 16 glycosylhydrolase [Phytoactinopolyspora halotolerans]
MTGPRRRTSLIAAMTAALALPAVGALTGHAQTADTTDARAEAVAQTAPLAANGGPSFVEDFDAPLNRDFWYVADGYRNGTYQNCTFNENNVAVADGMLTLTLDDTAYAGQDYSCGVIQSTQPYGYGTYETSMRVDQVSGTNQSLFTYTGPTQGTQWHEIDVEMLGKDTTEVELNTWVNGVAAGGGPVPVGVDNSQEFVHYAFIWEPDRVRFYINGELARTYTDPAQVPTVEQRIFTMIWSTDTLTDWMGPFEYPGRPVTTEYEYVAFTKAGEECQFAESLACDVPVEPVTDSFVDDFDTLDTSRWFVSDGWRNGAQQNCIWDADQARASGGMLNLTFVERATGDLDYACAEVQHRQPLGYGTYEIRMKAVGNSGIVSSYSTYVGAGDDGPAEGIDIAKLFGVDTGDVELRTSRYNQPMVATSADVSPPADEAFHDYGMVWSADRLDFYLDGEIVHSVTDPAKIPLREAKMYLSLWGSETTTEMGEFVPPDGPLTTQIDRIAYTAPGDPCQFTGSIAC